MIIKEDLSKFMVSTSVQLSIGTNPRPFLKPSAIKNPTGESTSALNRQTMRKIVDLTWPKIC